MLSSEKRFIYYSLVTYCIMTQKNTGRTSKTNYRTKRILITGQRKKTVTEVDGGVIVRHQLRFFSILK